MRLAIAFDAILRSTLGSVISLQFERSRSDLSSLLFRKVSSIFLHSSYESGGSQVSCASPESLGDSTMSVNVSYAVSEKIKSEVYRFL